MNELHEKVVITGAAGLVGQNLVLLLCEAGFTNIVAIDKHRHNLAMLQSLNPGVKVVHADLAEEGSWPSAFEGATFAIVLHAQITALTDAPFTRNNIDASARVLDACRRANVSYTVQVSSSVVKSVASDHYTRSKKAQEALFLASGLGGCVLRPTLMYGWFDPKHLGWLASFMARTPVFPIPGNGQFTRQPLYNRDFCRAILWCLRHRPVGKTFDLVGNEDIAYIDIIREIRKAKGLRTALLEVPFPLFDFMLRSYARFSSKPPFTSAQLHALVAGDRFDGVDLLDTFGFSPTPFAEGIRETFCHPVYSRHAVAWSA